MPIPRLADRSRANFSRCWMLIAALAGLLLAGCAGVPKHPTWSNATGAEQHERLMWQAVRDKDWANMERHLAPTFVGVDAAGRAFDRAGWMEYWKSAQLKEFSLGEVSVQPEGADMVVAYVLHLSPPAASATEDRGIRVVSVWQQVKTRWILIATSHTPLANP